MNTLDAQVKNRRNAGKEKKRSEPKRIDMAEANPEQTDVSGRLEGSRRKTRSEKQTIQKAAEVSGTV